MPDELQDWTRGDGAVPDRTEQIGRLLQRAERLLGAVQAARQDTPAERIARQAHELREHVAALLILCEGLARETGNGSMVELDSDTGRARFTVELDHTDPLPDS